MRFRKLDSRRRKTDKAKKCTKRNNKGNDNKIRELRLMFLRRLRRKDEFKQVILCEELTTGAIKVKKIGNQIIVQEGKPGRKSGGQMK